MAIAALFIGYGSTAPGHAQCALHVFNDALQYNGCLQQQGQIESFRPMFLESHGSDLAGFIFLRGDRNTLNGIRFTEGSMRLTNPTSLVVQNVGMVSGFIGEELNRLFQDFRVQASALG